MALYGKFRYGEALYGTGDPLWNTVRTYADIENDTDNAYVNYWDLNRIENRIKELGEILSVSVNIKTNWGKQTSSNLLSNLPNTSHLTRIINNVKIIVEALPDEFDKESLKFPDSLEYLTIQKMNDLERSLYIIYKGVA